MRLLDRLAAGALPALEEVEREGWLLRATPGSFKRSNSALPLVDDPGPVEVVERFYAARGLPAQVQVTSERVDQRLAGWRRHDEVLVLAGPLPVGRAGEQLGDVDPGSAGAAAPGSALDTHRRDLSRDAPDNGDQEAPVCVSPAAVTLRAEPWDAWTDCWWTVDGRPGGRETALAQLARVRQDSAYVAVEQGGEVVAVGRGALSDGWLGVFAMAVLPAHRGRGHGRAVLRALGTWASQRGGTGAYLQVLADNAPARRLYASAGLTPSHTYWYRSSA